MHVPDVRTHHFSNISVLVTSPGQYWCQVLDYTDGGDSHFLGKSNVAEVLSWEWYSSLPMCKGVQSVLETKCADLICPLPSVSPTTNKSSMCFIPMTKIQTHTITGEQLCMLFECMRYIHKVDEMVVQIPLAIELTSPLSPSQANDVVSVVPTLCLREAACVYPQRCW